jgi:branched-chain amino acid transport system substrate-binding protein
MTLIRSHILGSLTAAMFFIPALAQADITVAVVGGMSGPFDKIGSWFQNGTRGAIEEINDGGGLLGQQVKFIVRDDNCEPDKAADIAKELVGLGVKLVMGHLCSDASIAASEIYDKNGIIEISPSSTSPAYTDRGLNNIFRTTGRDDMQGFVLAEHITRNFKTKRLGIIYDDNSYSRGVVEVARGFLHQAGIKEVFYEMAPGEPFNYSSLISKIATSGVNVILYPANPAQFGKFVLQAHEKGAKFRLIGGDTFTNYTVEEKDLRLLDGVQFSFPPDPAHDRKNKKIVKKYKKQGIRPEAFTFYSYGAVQVWAMAVKKAGSLDADKVSKVLKSEKFDTVLGEISFDKKGDISNPGFVIYFFNKGKKYYLE